jgi:ComEC/Rec2-related protein
MIVEREIAGFVLPFAAGAIAATMLPDPFFMSSAIPAATSFILVAISIFFLIHPSHQKWDRHIVAIILLFSSFGCGLLTGFTYNQCSISPAHIPQFISEPSARIFEQVKSGIEKIPFKNIATNDIISALITGDRSEISPEIISTFRESGASHILALSGLHIGIIYGIISWLLSFMGHSPYANKIRTFLIISSCGIYTLITGAGASITRAFFFIVIRETSRLCNRYTSTAQVLMCSLFIQLLIFPGAVRDIGFQLSYAAMAGIAFLYPGLKDLWPEGKGGIMKWVWSSASMSISCQITTGPLA